MNRDEYLNWAKARANEFLDGPTPHKALSSLIDDFSRHPDMTDVLAIVMQLGMPLAANGHLTDPNKLRKFINDFD